MGRKKLSNCGIYQITNKINNKVYIGSSCNLKSRKRQHFSDLRLNKHSNKHLQNAFNIYQEKNFVWDIIERIQKIEDSIKLKEMVLCREQEYLNKFIKDGEIDDKICYNLSIKAGSNYGYKHTLATRNNMRKAQIGNKNAKGSIRTKENRDKIGNSLRGKPHPKSGKKVINLSTNEIFNSILEASQYYNLYSSNIIKACKNNHLSSGGFKWSYYKGE